MSLATRCTACGTVFRVVQDQLKVSEGWVRCGRCQEVFNALESLFDLERDAAHAPAPAAEAPAPPPEAPTEPPPAVGASISGRVPLDSVPPSDGVDVPIDIEAPPVEPRADDAAGEPPAGALTLSSESATSTDGDSEGADTATGFADARFNTSLMADDAAAEEAALQDAAAPDRAATATAADAEATDAGPPSFLAEAEQAARPPRRGVRAALALACVGLSALLLAQVALQFHDTIAARWPAWRGPLAVLCEAAGCVLEPPRQLDAIAVDSSGLQRIADNADAYRLSVVLRNRAGFAVAAPSVELSLTDANGQMIARRVFAPADFQGTPLSLTPHDETPMLLVLASSEVISGYSIEIFYP